MGKVILLAVVLLSASLVCGAKFLACVTMQSTTHVWPRDFDGQTLDQSIHSESVKEGDTIIVRGGTWNEHLNLNKSIVLEGGYQSDLYGPTILQGGGNGKVVDISVGNVTLNDFTVRNGAYGILIEGSTNTILRNNNLTGNIYNFGVSGFALQDFIQDVDTSNTIDGWPIYYWVNKTGGTISGHAGYVAVVNSTNVKVEHQNLANNYQGILLAYTNSSIVVDNTLSDDEYGIQLYSSEYNEIRNNSLSYDACGIGLGSSNYTTVLCNSISNSPFAFVFTCSNGNLICRNNIVHCLNIGSESSVNDFNNSREGNYWDNPSHPYRGNDTDLDGVGDTDTPYSADYHPLMEPWQMNRTFNVARFKDIYCFSTISNSTVARASVNWNRTLKRIGFNVTSGTAESINITIPRNWTDGPFEVRLNGENHPFNVSQDSNNSYIYLDYDPGTYMVEIVGTGVLGYRSGDINGDGTVDIYDAVTLARNFGYSDS